MKTYLPATNLPKKWVVVDAEGQVVGRLASRIASILRGKENPAFTAHADTGDFVVVINAEKVRFTGQKLEKKIYRHYTGFIGGLKEEVAGELMERRPEDIIKNAVRGMLPKNILGRQQLSKLKVYTGGDHPHLAQGPQQITL